ncbi:hypothetical protein [Microbulbifer sediminum]|uniref:hypothetical protein n=1 Tax=Microbulbifer sediminum TaxID=2904250 RepID=UPI001F1C6D12|nr:hypothetical protein [Microbulbifer sediminum]
MNRYMPLLALMVPLALVGCGREEESETIDLEQEVPAESTSDMDSMPESDQSQDMPQDESPSTGDQDATGPQMGDTSEVEVCTEEWFAWLNQKVITNPDLQAELDAAYPDGPPEVGSDEWFLAMDKLTGGDGAHGPDGGSDEWCNMMQSRVDKMSNAN